MDAIKRETMQLWFIAKYYHELSCDIMSDIPEELLDTKVGHFADSFDAYDIANKNKPLMYSTAHLMSCAVRLVSIDEALKTERWSEYECLSKEKDQQKVVNTINNDISPFIHHFLRHMVAHSERKAKSNATYNTMYSIYLSLTYREIFEYMSQIMSVFSNEVMNA